MTIPTNNPTLKDVTVEMVQEALESMQINETLGNGASLSGVARNPEDLFRTIHIACVISGAQRPLLHEAWKGPGHYLIVLREGASQEQDVFKMDDTWLEVIHDDDDAE